MSFLSCPIQSYPVLSLSHNVLSCPILSYSFLLCPISSYSALFCPILSYSVLFCPTLSYPVLSSPILSYSVLFCPILSCMSFSFSKIIWVAIALLWFNKNWINMIFIKLINNYLIFIKKILDTFNRSWCRYSSVTDWVGWAPLLFYIRPHPHQGGGGGARYWRRHPPF